MILVDDALQARQAAGNPIRVGVVGAGFMCQGLTNQIAHGTVGMRVVAISNRKVERAAGVFKYSGYQDVAFADTQRALDDAIASERPVVTEDAFLLARSGPDRRAGRRDRLGRVRRAGDA